MTKKHRQGEATPGNTDAAGREDIAEARASALAHADRELHIPLSSRAVFWQPRHVAVSDELIHVPYLFWLMENVRPRRIVQIGLGDGIGFLALCQAVDKLNLEAPCIGIDPTGGDDGAEAILPAPFQEQHATHYGDFSFILRDRPERALRYLPDGEIDLLVVNAPLSDALVMTLRVNWQPRLSNRAAVVVHDGAVVDGQAGREFIDELARSGAGIRIQQGARELETILVGDEQPERLLRLSRLEPGAPGALAARQVFLRLGQGLVNTERAKAAESSLADLRAQIETLEERLAEREDDLAAACEEREAARSAEEAQARQMAELQARLFDAEQAAKAQTDRDDEIEKLRAELSEAQHKRKAFYTKGEELSARVEELERQLAEAGEAHEAAAAKLGEELSGERQAREAADARVEELAEAKRALETTLEERLADIVALSEGFEKRLAVADADAEELKHQLAEAGAAHEAATVKLSEELSGERQAREAADADAEELRHQLAEAAAAHEAVTVKLDEELSGERQAREAADARAKELAEAKRVLETTLEERLADIVALSEGFEKRLADSEADHTREIEALRDEKQKLESDLEARVADIAALTADSEKRLAVADAQAEQLRTQLSERDSQLAGLTERLEKQDAELDETRAHRDALLSSTSWKITAPARKVIDAARGRREPPAS